ncbi:MAG: hypothetical protein ABWY06_19925 [Pseudomonas sp.]|uniref:hypothetical protein n=1 Tax=Pseudomonas sp. TaxID=306 RepID=UPI003392EE86
MKNAISIQMTLTPKQAEALLVRLRERLSRTVQERMFDDEFRLVPKESRGEAVVKASPALTAENKTIVALRVAVAKQA